MNTRFIEMDSTHRNRVEFPHPASFIAPFSSSSLITKDPVLDGAIYYTFSSSYQPTVFYPLKAGTTNSSPKLYVSNLVQQPSQSNYYAGYVILVSYVDTSGNTMTGMKMITHYNPTDLSVTLDTAFSFNDNHNLQAGDLYSLFELNTPSIIHLPDTDSYSNKALMYDEAYDGYYIIDETLSYGTTIVARLIENYDVSLRYCFLQTPFPSDRWSPFDSYTLRKTLPSEKWELSSPTVYNDRGLLVFSMPPDANGSDHYYVGKYIYWPAAPSEVENGQFAAIYGTYPIVEYNGFTRKAICYNNSNTTPLPTKGDVINIVNLSYDNFSPLIYNGTRVTQNQVVCYEISLVSLILPNVTLTTGSRIAFYPYLYVELSNTTTSSAASQNIIYSNNPESGRALFIIAVTDMVQPVNSHFVKLLGKMKQVVKFKPNDSLRLRVYLPSGELFQSIKKDLFSPYAPDPLLQINALFSIKHM